MTYQPRTTSCYKQIGDCQIRVDIFRNDSPNRQPALIWVHGGALIFGSRKMLAPSQLAQYLSAGYTVFAIDYRLDPETKLDQIVADVCDAVTWIRKHGPDIAHIDPERIAVIGHSAGGYLALSLGYRLAPPQAIISFYGYGDILGDWYTQPDAFYRQSPLVTKSAALATIGKKIISATENQNRFTYYLYCRQQGSWPAVVSGHDPQTEPAWFERYSPVQNVSPNFPPTLLLHGTADTDVPVGQSAQMARLLAKAHVPHEFLRLSGLGHVFDRELKNPLVEKAFDRVLDFLAEYLAK